MIKTVSVQELCEQLETDTQSVLIDVRQPEEYEQGHVPQARNIPLGSMPLAQILAEWGREAEGKPIYFICQSGGRSQQLLDELAQVGFHGAQCVAGGMVAWQAMGLPVENKPQATLMPLQDRWIKLATGGLMLVGCGLGLCVHRDFFSIPVLLSAEMVCAGLMGRSLLDWAFVRKNRGR